MNEPSHRAGGRKQLTLSTSAKGMAGMVVFASPSQCGSKSFVPYNEIAKRESIPNSRALFLVAAIVALGLVNLSAAPR